jgi:hypothetical protein
VNNVVVRRSFACLLALIASSFLCGPALAQIQAGTFANDSALPFAPAPTLPLSLSVQFPPTDDSLTALVPLGPSFPSSSISDPGNLAASLSLNTLTLAVPSWAPSPAPSSPKPTPPKPTPRPFYYENPNKWQLGLAFALVRFRSSLYYASAPGLNTALAYWLKDWIAVEGSITTAFAPAVFENEHFRYLGYAAGPKFSFGHGRFEPWAHALVGGVHLIPQTAASGRNGFEFTMGGGVDYVLSSVISAKLGVDYLGTHMFGEWQSSAQVVAGFSFRF